MNTFKELFKATKEVINYKLSQPGIGSKILDTTPREAITSVKDAFVQVGRGIYTASPASVVDSVVDKVNDTKKKITQAKLEKLTKKIGEIPQEKFMSAVQKAVQEVIKDAQS